MPWLNVILHRELNLATQSYASQPVDRGNILADWHRALNQVRSQVAD